MSSRTQAAEDEALPSTVADGDDDVVNQGNVRAQADDLAAVVDVMAQKGDKTKSGLLSSFLGKCNMKRSDT